MVRGILDFFSPFSSDPVRIEFWGDEIDSMSSFDVLTQRRTDPLESCTVLPAAEVLPTLSAGGVEVLAREMDAAASRLAKRRTSENAAALAANMRADAERLRNGVLLSDADRYLPVIYPMASGLDYVSPDALVFLDQPARCGERARDYIKRLADDIRELGRRALVPASEENFYLSFEAMLKRLKDFPLYMADAFTAGRTPIEPRTMMSIPAKQLPSYAGNAQTAADDARQLLKAGWRAVLWQFSPGINAARRCSVLSSMSMEFRLCFRLTTRPFRSKIAVRCISGRFPRGWNIRAFILLS